MTELAVRREGSGPTVLLVHGGATPERTWQGLEPLAERWTLAYVYRRGYPPSPPGLLDFELDAVDLGALLDAEEAPPHVISHSYGGLGSLIAAGERPGRVASITIIESPLYGVAAGDPEVAHLQRIGDSFLTEGLGADREVLVEFLALAGAPPFGDGPIPDAVARGIERAHGGRLPGEARPRLDRLRAAGTPALIASGGHHDAMERLSDALARELGGERAVLPGAGHFVTAAPGFLERYERFLEAVQHAPT